jgi:sigma-B regulation protein RsbU (phosphoserine phosphatase)
LSAADILSLFQHDAAALVVGVVLCTLGVMLLTLAAVSRGTEFLLTGFFALAYGVRLILNTAWMAESLAHPVWLNHLRAQLEYVVPIPGALLFVRYASKFRRMSRIAAVVVASFAAIAIPAELILRQPFAMKNAMDVLVVALMVVFAMNLYSTRVHDGRRVGIIRAGSIVLLLFVLNEHFRVVHDSIGLTREPVGFLFFVVTIVISTMRDSVRAQRRLVEVDSELATARKIQLSTLPRHNPELAGLEIATVYTPASDVAGDFYDFLPIDDARLGVFIADVSGHGVPAALVASMLKVAVATQSAHAASPAILLRELNLLFCGKLERQFITAAYAFIDLEAGEVTVATAGHPAPLLHADDLTDEIVAQGPILGRFRAAEYEQVTRRFRRSDTLLLYTDGVTESRNAADDLWGEERLRAVVADHDGSAATLLERVVAQVESWAGHGAAPGDDITMIAVRRT